MASSEHETKRGLLRFEADQKTFEFGGVPVGGQPGVRPVVLVGSIFYHGQKIIIDENEGEFRREDAERLGCVAEIEHAREILARGTSAHTQRHVYGAALAAGADREEALRDVVDWLIDETVKGTAPASDA